MTKVIEITISEKIKSASRTELGEIAKKMYADYLQGKSVINEDKGFKITFSSQGKYKISKGSALYSKKVAVIKHLAQIVKEAKYSNFSRRKSNDPKELIGYLNFKGKCKINGKVEYLRISCLFYSADRIFFNHEINIIKKR